MRAAFVALTAVLLVSALTARRFTGIARPLRRQKEPTVSSAAYVPQGVNHWLTAGSIRLKARIFRSAAISERPILIVVLHGDSPFGPPSYQYTFAAEAAAKMSDAIVAALLRPGYCDGTGDCSEGERGLTSGDNYTPEVIHAVVDVVAQLTAEYHARDAILVGHSGGAAISAGVLSSSPTVVDGALLISCPCDVPVWREHMAKLRPNPIWRQPVHSLSPIDLVKDVPERVHVRMLVGSEDSVAPPDFTKEYADALKKRGVDVVATIAPGLEHDILLEPIAYDQLRLLLESVEKDANH